MTNIASPEIPIGREGLPAGGHEFGDLVANEIKKFIQRRALPEGHVEDLSRHFRILGACCQYIGLDAIVDETEVAARLSVSVDPDLITPQQPRKPFGDDRGIGSFRVLTLAEDIEVAQTHTVETVGFEKDLGVEFVDVLGHRVGREGFADDLLDLRGNPIAGAYAEYQSGNWQWRVTYAQIEFKHDLPGEVAALRAGLNQASRFGFAGAAEAAESISLTDTVSRFYSLGAVYDRGPLQLQGMLAQIRHESAIYQDSLAGYLIAGYRIGQITPFAGIASSRSTAESVSSGLPAAPQFAALNAGLDGAIARTHTDQTTYTLGVRWDFRRDMALKAQVDMVRGTRDSIWLYPTSTAGFDGKLNIYSLALDFVF